MSTLAGSNAGGYADGIGADAKFNYPTAWPLIRLAMSMLRISATISSGRLSTGLLGFGAKFGDVFQFGEKNEKKYRR